MRMKWIGPVEYPKVNIIMLNNIVIRTKDPSDYRRSATKIILTNVIANPET
jgi:hypothetical protein